MRVQGITLSAVALTAGFMLAQAPRAAKPQAAATQSKPATSPTSFESTVPPVFTKSCAMCHNDRLASGGLNLGPFTDPKSVLAHRDEWERILQKIRTGEMPPKGMPRPPAEQLEAMSKFIHE